MNPRIRMLLALTAAGGLLVAGVVFGALRMRTALATGEETLRVWFYDQSEQRLYTVPRDTLPPDAGIGGAAGDGVRAIVVSFAAARDDADRQRIAYLETYTPELKNMLEDIRAARAAGRAYAGARPADDSDFFAKNTLVRRPDEATWHPTTSAEGDTIMHEWQSWRGPNGSCPLISTP